MDEILKIAAGAGGGGILVVIMYTRVLAARLDDIRDRLVNVDTKIDRLDELAMDHEVRLRVMELVGKEDHQ